MEAVKKLSRSATEALNNLGGKIVGLQWLYLFWISELNDFIKTVLAHEFLDEAAAAGNWICTWIWLYLFRYLHYTNYYWAKLNKIQAYVGSLPKLNESQMNVLLSTSTNQWWQTFTSLTISMASVHVTIT